MKFLSNYRVETFIKGSLLQLSYLSRTNSRGYYEKTLLLLQKREIPITWYSISSLNHELKLKIDAYYSTGIEVLENSCHSTRRKKIVQPPGTLLLLILLRIVNKRSYIISTNSIIDYVIVCNSGKDRTISNNMGVLLRILLLIVRFSLLYKKIFFLRKVYILPIITNNIIYYVIVCNSNKGFTITFVVTYAIRNIILFTPCSTVKETIHDR